MILYEWTNEYLWQLGDILWVKPAVMRASQTELFSCPLPTLHYALYLPSLHFKHKHLVLIREGHHLENGSPLNESLHNVRLEVIQQTVSVFLPFPCWLLFSP